MPGKFGKRMSGTRVGDERLIGAGAAGGTQHGWTAQIVHREAFRLQGATKRAFAAVRA